MFWRDSKNMSYMISFSFHLLLILIFLIVKFGVEFDEDQYLTVGFGKIGSSSSSGALGNVPVPKNENIPKEVIKEKSEPKEKKVEVPKAKNTDNDNLITAADKKKEKKDVQPEKVKPLKEADPQSKGEELSGEGDGNFGFEIDFGGKGMRKIYSYSLPPYPEGVSKEIDVKLRFSILPDGTVGKIFPLIKADARLELVAINSLRQWRFEPLPANVKQVEQTVVITFPYRLQ